MNKMGKKSDEETNVATMVMWFPAKKNAGCPKAPRDFPTEKIAFSSPPSGCHGIPLPLHHSLYGPTLTPKPKFFCIDRLPDLITHWLLFDYAAGAFGAL